MRRHGRGRQNAGGGELRTPVLARGRPGRIQARRGWRKRHLAAIEGIFLSARFVALRMRRHSCVRRRREYLGAGCVVRSKKTRISIPTPGANVRTRKYGLAAPSWREGGPRNIFLRGGRRERGRGPVELGFGFLHLDVLGGEPGISTYIFRTRHRRGLGAPSFVHGRTDVHVIRFVERARGGDPTSTACGAGARKRAGGRRSGRVRTLTGTAVCMLRGSGGGPGPLERRPKVCGGAGGRKGRPLKGLLGLWRAKCFCWVAGVAGGADTDMARGAPRRWTFWA